MDAATRDRARARRGWPRWAKVLLVAGALLFGLPLVVRMLFVGSYRIPSGAMYPTLHVGDHLFATRTGAKPRRGEVVVFEFPRDPSKDYIKRVIGVGGDTIRFDGDAVVLNGKPIPRKALPGPCFYPVFDGPDRSLEPRACKAYEEVLGGVRYRVIQDPVGHSAPPAEAITVPEGQLFVMGDNRDNSHDSRHFGFVPVENLRARASIIWWPGGGEGRFGRSIHQRVE